MEICEVCKESGAGLVACAGYDPTLCDTCRATLRRAERAEAIRLLCVRYPELADRRSTDAAAE